MLIKRIVALILLAGTFLSISQAQEATSYTREHNVNLKTVLALQDSTEWKEAWRGYISPLPKVDIKDSLNRDVFNVSEWDFLGDKAPDTANPSLWRQGQLNRISGLFEIVPQKIYQVRGLDFANLTFIRSNQGWIVLHALMSEETARSAYDLVKKEVGNYPVKAIIYPHSNSNHFAGAKGLMKSSSNEENDSIQIIAPDGFVEFAINENLMTGTAMIQRSRFMNGQALSPGGKGLIGTGLGLTTSKGTKSFVLPDLFIKETFEKLNVDGVEMEVLMNQPINSPSMLMIYFPQLKAFATMETINHSMHNLLPLRGAKVRNGRTLSRFIDEAIKRYGDKVEISFDTHFWPVYGSEKIKLYWEKQRDMYRFIHDQTLRLANQGYSGDEIAARLHLPEDIHKDFANREYYGSLSQNIKSQYQLYMGYFDGNPVNINPLSPKELHGKYLEALGGKENVVSQAKRAYDKGEYQWSATLLDHLIYVDSDNKYARSLLADAYTQLGYKSENATWRNYYLTAAKELRGELITFPGPKNNMYPHLDLEMIFDKVAILINGEKASKMNYVFNIVTNDSQEKVSLILKHGALTNRMNVLAEHPTVYVLGEKRAIIELFLKQKELRSLILSSQIKIQGNQNALIDLLDLYEEENPNHHIALPQ